MKINKIFLTLSLLSLSAMAIFAGCKKASGDNVFSEYDIVDEAATALIKINYNVAFYNNPSTQIKINGVRVSAANIQNRTPFPGGGLNTLGGNTGDYLPVTPGNTTISITVPKKGTNIDSLDVFTTTASLAAGKRYSLHVTDTLTRKGLLIDEDASVPDSGFVRMRFVNLMPTTPAVDLYIGAVKVSSNIAYMAISDKFLLPTSQAGISTVWSIRAAGAAATSTAIATYTSASTLQNQRVYTAYAIGYTTYPSSGTDIRKPYVAFYYVR
jgi:hypothetical protein